MYSSKFNEVYVTRYFPPLEETAKSPGEDKQTEGQLPPSGCQEAEPPPILAPPSPLLHHTPLNYDPPHHHRPPTHTHTHTHTVTSTSHFVQHWTDLIQLPLLTV